MGTRFDDYFTFEDIAAYAGELTAWLLAEPGCELVGVYLHGSAVLGDFDQHRSDVNVLAVIAGPADAATQARIGEALVVAGADGCPGWALEMSVITAQTAAGRGSCRSEVHVVGDSHHPSFGRGDTIAWTSADLLVDPLAVAARVDPFDLGQPLRPQDEADRLVLGAETSRTHGHPIYGPPPGQLFRPVPPARVVAAMLSTSGVLNACRTLRFATDNVLCSKEAGGAWAQERYSDEPVIAEALARRRQWDREDPMSPAAKRFVAGVRDRVAGILG